MKVIFISYWGLEDPLCVSTVVPHVELLASYPDVRKVHLFTFERGMTVRYPGKRGGKICHHAIRQSKMAGGLQFPLSYLRAFCKIVALTLAEKIDLIVGRSTFAAIIGHWVWSCFGIPYTVESFEPHADYMIDNGVWVKGSWKEWLFRRWEEQVKRTCFKMYPVSRGFARQLRQDGIRASRIEVLPCTIDEHQFCFDETLRFQIRRELGIPHDKKVGVYVGKFGGMYLGEEARSVLERLAWSMDSHFLLLTNPDNEVCRGLLESDTLRGRVTALWAKPELVPGYLSASDYALVLTRSTATSRYLSPIKVGEYLMSGLPVVIGHGIGDDSDLIREHDLGVVAENLDLKQPHLDQILRLVNDSRTDSRIAIKARTLRGRSLARDSYRRLLDAILRKQNIVPG